MLCYASVFHWQQLISAYFQHNDDFEIYPNLGKIMWLYTNFTELNIVR
jgi:hypothetical protein